MKTQVTEEKKEKKESSIGTFMVYAIAILYIGLGITFLVVPQLQTAHLCYLLAVCLILLGIIKIGEYFIKESYRNINQYGFSIGVISIILGICVIIRIEQFVDIFNLCLGVGILLTAVIKIQNAMDLRALEAGGFPLFLAIGIIMVICAVVILINPFTEETVRNQVTYVIMIVDGILSLISTFYLKKQTTKEIEHENEQEQEV